MSCAHLTAGVGIPSYMHWYTATTDQHRTASRVECPPSLFQKSTVFSSNALDEDSTDGSLCGLAANGRLLSRIPRFKTCRVGRCWQGSNSYAPLQLAAHMPTSAPLTRMRCVTSTHQAHLEMVVSIPTPGPRTRASDWESDMPVGAITGRQEGFSASAAQSMHGSLREDSPRT